jgi:hypothetical protein
MRELNLTELQAVNGANFIVLIEQPIYYYEPVVYYPQPVCYFEPVTYSYYTEVPVYNRWGDVMYYNLMEESYTVYEEYCFYV